MPTLLVIVTGIVFFLVSDVDANPISHRRSTWKPERTQTANPSAKEERRTLVERDFTAVAVICALLLLVIVVCCCVAVCRNRKVAKQKSARPHPLIVQEYEDFEVIVNGGPLPIGVDRPVRTPDRLRWAMPASMPTVEGNGKLKKNTDTDLNSATITATSTKSKSTASVPLVILTPTPSNPTGPPTTNTQETQEDLDPQPKSKEKSLKKEKPEKRRVGLKVPKIEKTQTLESQEEQTPEVLTKKDVIENSVKVQNYELPRAPRKSLLLKRFSSRKSSAVKSVEDKTQSSKRIRATGSRVPLQSLSKAAKSQLGIVPPLSKTLKQPVKTMDVDPGNNNAPINQARTVKLSPNRWRREEEEERRQKSKVTADDIMVIRAGEQFMADEEDEDDEGEPPSRQKTFVRIPVPCTDEANVELE